MCRNNVCILPVIVAIVLGIVIGALFFVGTIVTGILAIPVSIGLIFAAITLILLFVAATFGFKKETKECVCEYGRCLTLGIFVTIIAGILILTFLASLVAGGIISALLVGIFAFGLILNIWSFIGFIICLIRANCYRNNNNCKFENDYVE